MRSTSFALRLSPLLAAGLITQTASADSLTTPQIIPSSRVTELFEKSEPFNSNGDRIPDFFRVGYNQGDSDGFDDIQSLPVIHVSAADAADHTTLIQQAIDTASGEPLADSGYRAVIQLTDGTYTLTDSLEIRTSGIILRGTTQTGTILFLNSTRQISAIDVHGEGLPQIKGTPAPVSVDYIPCGAVHIPVTDASPFSPGDEIILRHAHNQEWIKKIGMDHISPNLQKKNGALIDTTRQWQAKEYVYEYLRRIDSIQDNTLILDIPTVQPLDATMGDTTVARCTYPGRISHIGLENLTIESSYDPSIQEENTYVVESGVMAFSDESHGKQAVTMDALEQAWVRNVTAKHFVMGCVHIERNASHVTISDCQSLDPVSKIVGGRRYSFLISGQLNLVKNCYARGGRHDFVLNNRVCGPNVFYDCLSENAFNCSEPHHRMSYGLLYDNVKVFGPGAAMAVLNRDNNGTGHGWMGAQVIFWNCAAPMIIVQHPPIGENFAIGMTAKIDRTTPQFLKNMDRRLGLTTEKSKIDFQFDGTGFIGNGIFSSPKAPVKPDSLYQFQRQKTASH